MSDEDGSFSPGPLRPPPGVEGHEAPQAPPGLGPEPEVRPSDRRVKWAAALLLAGGGFVLVAGLVTALWTGSVAAFLEESDESQDPESIAALQAVRTAAILVGLAVGGIMIAGGAGVFYRQPWSRGVGIAGAALLLVFLPIGTAMGIAAITMLAGKGTEGWFR